MTTELEAFLEFAETDESLKHYGVKGMKWGVRRSPEQLRRARLVRKGETKMPKGRKMKTASAKNKSSSTSAPKNSVKTLSDQELRDRISRIKLEREYKSLTAPQKSAGRKAVEDILANSAKSTATAYTTAFMKAGVAAGLKKAKINVKPSEGKKKK